MNENIIKFLTKEHILTLCLSDKNIPYACSCFYVFDKISTSLVIASKNDSTHSQIINKNSNVAINIALNTKILGKIKGVQALGNIQYISNLAKAEQQQLKFLYFARFPYALAMKAVLYKIEILWLKYTDNCLKNKIIWQKNA